LCEASQQLRIDALQQWSNNNTFLWLGNTPGTFKCLQKTEALINGVIPPMQQKY